MSAVLDGLGNNCENCGEETENPRYCDFCLGMKNKAMARKLRKNEAIDVSGFAQTDTGDYILPDFVDNVDYCDKEREVWIGSIGENIKTKEIRASVSTIYYQNSDYKC